MLSYKSSLYILDITSLPNISLANIFTLSADCLFTFLMFLFIAHKLFSLIQSHLFFLLPPLSEMTRSKNILLGLMSERTLPLFSSGLWFRALHLIHFEFIFVYGVRKQPSVFHHVAVQFSQHLVLKRLSSPHWTLLPPLFYINQLY